jgi:hypothetical protein
MNWFVIVSCCWWWWYRWQCKVMLSERDVLVQFSMYVFEMRGVLVQQI